MISMISGLHDSRWLNNILDNFNRQDYKFKRLIIVENGNGIGFCNNIDLPKNVIILQSESGVGQYINAGIKWLQENAWTDWWAKCDADDYYGVDYLEQINEAAKTDADYAGRNKIYVRTLDNHLWFVNGKSKNVFHGPTLAGKVKSTVLFPLVKEWGEDAGWCREMSKNKKSYVINSHKGFCYQRWNDYNHSWPCTDIELRTSWLISMLDLGEFDLNIVNSGNNIGGKILEVPEVNESNFMPFRILRERGLNNVGLH